MRILIRQVRGRKKHPNWSGIVAEVEATLESEVKPRLLKYPRKVVANWDHKPVFKSRKTVTRDYVAIDVFPAGPNKKFWVWTSRGTKKHIIRPKKADGVLAFPSAYASKTSPRGPSYGGSGKSSGPTIFSRGVMHPGTKPRHFEEAWKRYTLKWFRKTVENAMRRGARRA